MRPIDIYFKENYAQQANRRSARLGARTWRRVERRDGFDHSSGIRRAAAGSSLASSCFLAKTKFVLHAGLAFGAFHRYIYKPYKAHAFTGPDKVKTIAKAAVAGAFVYHEVKIALQDAKCSKTLSVVVSPLTALGTGFTGLVAKLKGGSVDGAGLASLGKGVDSVGSLASRSRGPIVDIAHGL